VDEGQPANDEHIGNEIEGSRPVEEIREDEGNPNGGRSNHGEPNGVSAEVS
jgi:hypothetical protein